MSDIPSGIERLLDIFHSSSEHETHGIEIYYRDELMTVREDLDSVVRFMCSIHQPTSFNRAEDMLETGLPNKQGFSFHYSRDRAG